MIRLNSKIISVIQAEGLGSKLLKGRFGLEKENVRVDREGQLATTPHPEILGSKEENPYITTDFSESQIEIITPPQDSLEKAFNFLETLHNTVAVSLKEELLWPQSLPPILPEEHKIPIADFRKPSNPDEEDPSGYRHKLAEKYGRHKQMISGIHYNYSFDESLLTALHKSLSPDKQYRDFKDEIYMRVSRNIISYGWFLIRFLGNSPSVDHSYSYFCSCCPPEPGSDRFAYASSIRNGECGYRNKNDLDVSLNSLEEYVSSLKQHIDSGELIHAKEYYSIIRPKDSRGSLNSLASRGIEYLELRILDNNPLHKNGVSLEDLYFVHLFFLFALLVEEFTGKVDFMEAHSNNRYVADNGLRNEITIFFEGENHPVNEIACLIFDSMKEISSLTDDRKQELQIVIGNYRAMLENSALMYPRILQAEAGGGSLIAYNLQKAELYRKKSLEKEFNVIGYEDLELSTQILILDAIKRGISVEILDRKENFISLQKGQKIEYIRQATKTSVDSYVSVLLMENKQITKKILMKKNIRVPEGFVFDSKEEAFSAHGRIPESGIVIKPNSTNFGLGISIFKEGYSKGEFETAVSLAFEKDSQILVEVFAPGREYRVFVVGDEVVGVLHRVPANVKGNGHSSIRELVKEKNANPLRGKGYRTPLEKISLGIEEEIFLSLAGLNFDSVPEEEEVVFLRENSNISTGGDSIDYTDQISKNLKAIAVRAAQAVGAHIVGVDLMTTDISSEATDKYSIIELNFNPAIHIHCYPFVGKNRHLGDRILDILGFQQEEA